MSARASAPAAAPRRRVALSAPPAAQERRHVDRRDRDHGASARRPEPAEKRHACDAELMLGLGVGAPRRSSQPPWGEYRHAENVGLELHQQLVVDHAAIHLERRELHARILLHGVQHFARLVGRGLQRRAADVALVHERVSPTIAPRASACQCGRTGRRTPARNRCRRCRRPAGRVFDVLCEVEDLQIVAQPLHQRAGDGNRAFQRIDRRLVAQLYATVVSKPACGDDLWCRCSAA